MEKILNKHLSMRFHQWRNNAIPETKYKLNNDKLQNAMGD